MSRNTRRFASIETPPLSRDSYSAGTSPARELRHLRWISSKAYNVTRRAGREPGGSGLVQAFGVVLARAPRAERTARCPRERITETSLFDVEAEELGRAAITAGRHGRNASGLPEVTAGAPPTARS